jgi:hypothetical protein
MVEYKHANFVKNDKWGHIDECLGRQLYGTINNRTDNYYREKPKWSTCEYTRKLMLRQM